MSEKSINVYKMEQIMEAVIIKLGSEFGADIEEGIAAREFIVLKLLHYEDRTISDLADHLGITTEVMTYIIERMNQAGWILRCRDEADSRSKFGLTDKGVITFKKCWEKRENLINKYFSLLDQADQAKLIEILTKLFKIDHYQCHAG